MLVAADLQRPAAIQQLEVIGQQLGMPVYTEPGPPTRWPYASGPWPTPRPRGATW